MTTGNMRDLGGSGLIASCLNDARHTALIRLDRARNDAPSGSRPCPTHARNGIVRRIVEANGFSHADRRSDASRAKCGDEGRHPNRH